VVEINGEEKILEGSEAILAFLNNEFKLKPIAAATAEDITNMARDEKDSAGEWLHKADEVLSFFPGIVRAGRGSKVCGAASPSLNVSRPEKPLVLYSYEGNQFCRLVREVLTELDIVYELRSAGKNSPRREELVSISGSSQCPYLIDPNTGIKMPESKDIIEYLYKTYADFIPPSELLKLVSDVITPILAPIYRRVAPLQAGSSRENKFEYKSELAEAKAKIYEEIASAPVVICESSISSASVPCLYLFIPTLLFSKFDTPVIIVTRHLLTVAFLHRGNSSVRVCRDPF
jgi:glutaredoxin